MKKIFLFLIFFGYLLFAGEKVITLSGEMIGDRLINWHGPVIPAQNGRMELTGRSPTAYCVAKIPLEGNNTALIRFSVTGRRGTVGLYFYDEGGTFLGSDTERIPNTENERSFEAEFRIPALQANKRVFSVRVCFSAAEKLVLGNMVLYLQEDKR